MIDSLFETLKKAITNDKRTEAISNVSHRITAIIHSDNSKHIIQESKKQAESMITNLNLDNVTIRLSRAASDESFSIIELEKSISYKSGQDYITLKIDCNLNAVSFFSDIIYINNGTEKEKAVNAHYSGNSKPTCTLIIFDNGAIMRSVASAKNELKYFPSSIKDIRFFPKEVQSILLEIYAGKSLFYRDIIREGFYIPSPLSDVSKYYNKKDYLEKLFKMELPNTINKYPFNLVYAACCSAKYVKEDQIPLLFKFDSISDEMRSYEYSPSLRKRKAIAEEYLRMFINNMHEGIRSDILQDYIMFAGQLNEKIDIKAGKKKVRKYHDEMMARAIAKMSRGKKLVIPETPLKYLRLPDEFNLIKTKKSLLFEGLINRNCVGTYIDRINKGKCVIYSADINGEHLTIEIIYRNKRFLVPQCYTAYNGICKPETLAYVKECVESASADAVRKYKAEEVRRRKKNGS